MNDEVMHFCPICGGILSEIRSDGKDRWRHCYSCHFEFPESHKAYWKKTIKESSPDDVSFKQVCSHCGKEAPINNPWGLYDLTEYCPHCHYYMVYQGDIE